ncbi:hypothetical protein [Cellulomonas sp. Root137]|uniref:hypothetical protein n=1 Tax=Cellulomonas sp. Root137 TaxID=1736459 RepID=UPI0006F5D462|nr:hypothetical protein [Cellulomonas sp. Root137]KQY42850.1 hypothetical protein ASD18_17845 [Cellulomonas sp. Root137]
MTHDDVIAQLRSADPVAGLDLSHLDPGAVRALRQGITMTERDSSSTSRRRRIGRRSTLIAGLSIALVGGGSAYAVHQQWFGGTGDGPNCQSVWNETAAGVAMVSGPNLTGDPVADCDTYRAQAGLPPLSDPVAFEYGDAVFVTPRGQVPEGAELLAVSPTAGAERELRASMRDWVDGGSSHCFSTSEAEEFARAELDRLDLTGWTIVTDDVPDADLLPPGMECAALDMLDPASHTIDVLPLRSEDWERTAGPTTSGIRTALRVGIAHTCVSLGDAQKVAEAALGTEHHWPTTGVPDEEVDCARVDMEVGGSMQITIYGPATARP